LDICTYLSQEEILGYDLYWDAVSTAKTLATGKFKDGLDMGLEKGEKIGLEKGRAEGRAEGEKIGMEKGFAESRKETAIAMLKKGMPIDLTAEISKISVEEVEKLKTTLF
jgi:predicted transposase YdaD